jgi:hypothetical protein
MVDPNPLPSWAIIHRLSHGVTSSYHKKNNEVQEAKQKAQPAQGQGAASLRVPELH